MSSTNKTSRSSELSSDQGSRIQMNLPSSFRRTHSYGGDPPGYYSWEARTYTTRNDYGEEEVSVDNPLFKRAQQAVERLRKIVPAGFAVDATRQEKGYISIDVRKER